MPTSCESQVKLRQEAAAVRCKSTSLCLEAPLDADGGKVETSANVFGSETLNTSGEMDLSVNDSGGEGSSNGEILDRRTRASPEIRRAASS